MSTAIKVLELCPGESTAKNLWPGCEITSWDFASPIPESMFNQFDIVFSNNVLQRSSHFISQTLISTWGACLKDGGQLHLVVPSLEWAAREVLSENPSPISLIMLWGGQGADASVHMSGYTMRLLRASFEKAGLNVVAAKTNQYKLMVNDKEYPTEQHYVCGVKGRAELQKE